MERVLTHCGVGSARSPSFDRPRSQYRPLAKSLLGRTVPLVWKVQTYLQIGKTWKTLR